MRLVLVAVVVALAGGASCPGVPGEGDAGDAGDGDGDGDDEATDGGAAADGGSSSDAGGIAGDGDGDPTDGGEAADAGSSPDAGGIDEDDGPRYDEIWQKSAHNAYQRDEALIDQLVYHRLRSVELDIHTGKSGWPTTGGDWYVYHDGGPGGGETLCHRLSDCLDEIRAFMGAVPQHEVLTLVVDLKTGFSAPGHQPADLDGLLLAKLGAALFTPSDLLASCPGSTSLAGAIDACGWPRLSSLRGRALVMLTGASTCAAGGTLHDYAATGTSSFIAPEIDGGCPFASYAAHDDTVLFNMNFSQRAAASDVRASGRVGRVWGVELNTEVGWDAALGVGAHLLATDKVSYHADPWSRSHQANGWPFTCVAGVPCPHANGPGELGQVLNVVVVSEDIWGTADHFVFAHQDASAGPGGEWTALFSTANSHVDEFAKSCLMARQSLDGGSPYFAVCRTADRHRLRVQVRAGPSASSTATEAPDIVPADTVDQESLAQVRLVVTPDGLCASGSGSLDGESWVEIGSACFAAPLTLQGVGVSSHGGAEVRSVVVGLRREGQPVSVDALTPSPIGTVTSWSLGDGPL